MQTKRHILTLLAVLIYTFSHAQTNSITGTLCDAKSGEPMAFTNCVLLRTADSTFVAGSTTNDRGTMRFASVDSGEYLLRVSTVGYETYWQRLNVPPDTALGVIEIFQSSTTLQAVSVTAQRPLYSADGEKVFYHVEDDPSVQTGTMADVLQNAPGVEVDPEGNITLRGSSDVTIWLEAVYQSIARQQHQAHRGVEQPFGTLRHIGQHYQHCHRGQGYAQPTAVCRLQGQHGSSILAVGELCLQQRQVEP